MVVMTKDVGRLPVGRRIGDWLGQFLGDPISKIRTAIMKQALYEMSDERLAEIGVARDEVPAYAEKQILAAE